MARQRNRRRDWTLWSRPLEPPGAWEWEGYEPTEPACWHFARLLWQARGPKAEYEYLVLPPRETPSLEPRHT